MSHYWLFKNLMICSFLETEVLRAQVQVVIYIKVAHSRSVAVSSSCNCPGQTVRAVVETFFQRAGVICIFLHALLNAIITCIIFEEPVQHSHMKRFHFLFLMALPVNCTHAPHVSDDVNSYTETCTHYSKTSMHVPLLQV